MNTQAARNFRLQGILLLAGIILFLLKLAAWYVSGSVAVLSDALEGIVNIIAAATSLYALYLSSQPADRKHPYGHGKIEFLSSGAEGTMIILAALGIMYEAVLNFIHGHPLHATDTGLYLIAFTAAANYLLGWYSIRQGRRNHSPALISGGKHLQSDTWTTIGIMIGLLLIQLTGLEWIDSLVALLLSLLLIRTGYGIIRKAITGIMDEADEEVLEALVLTLNEHRLPNWIDLHNLRIIRYGSVYHVDAHLTVPWYFNVHQAHEVVEQLNAKVRAHFGTSVEMFVHTDGCLPDSCTVCGISGCAERKKPQSGMVIWDIHNITANRKHGPESLKQY
jgi:cation diffusion facilitator family transporter